MFFVTRVRLLARDNVVMGVETASRIVRKLKILVRLDEKWEVVVPEPLPREWIVLS